jgi:hypothetical protein
MKRSILALVFLMFIGLLAMGVSPAAAAPATAGFQRMLDDDGDGIPNGDDENYAPPLDGTGNKFGAPASATVSTASTSSVFTLRPIWTPGLPFTLAFWVPQLSLAGYGPGDGTCYDGDGPGGGIGNGSGPYGTGDCDCDGPNGPNGPTKHLGQ